MRHLKLKILRTQVSPRLSVFLESSVMINHNLLKIYQIKINQKLYYGVINPILVTKLFFKKFYKLNILNNT